MKKTRIHLILLWCMLALNGMGALADLIPADAVVKSFTHHGLPLYFLPLFGLLKLGGGIALVIPALANLRREVLAGFIYYFVGAIYVHIAVNDLPGLIAPVVYLGLAVATYLTRPKAIVAAQ